MKILVKAFVLLSLFCSIAVADAKTIKLAATEWPPFYGENLDDNGFMTEIIREALSRSGYDVKIDFLPWKRALASAQSGKHDGLFTVWYREEREEWFVFSDALPSNQLAFLKRKGNPIDSSNFEDLKGQNIGVVRGYAPPPGFAEAGLKTSEARDDLENLRKLEKGRVDLILADKIVAQHLINTAVSEMGAEVEWIDPPVHEDIQYLVFSKKAENYQKLKDAFNKSLAEMTEDGVLERIMAKHGF
ncbi:MAG: substrate-binding periplasmic protein [Rhodothermales bacterium]